jgi:methyltransferase-like protein
VQAAQNPYDAVAYPSLPFPNTHPDRLATMATLHGLNPAPVDRCRVLEIAASDGANLIPMAYAIPGSEFVGFDFARAPIERGQARIRELGLRNARLFQADLLDVGAELGHFDFIIAHGFYSWVAEPVRNRLMTLCGKLLAPEGVAFISYNALPGGSVRLAIREMMFYRMSGAQNVEQQVADAMQYVRWLLSARPESDAYRILLEEHLDSMAERSPHAIFHDELSEEHFPLSFVEFAAHAAKHGLQTICEAVLPPPSDPVYQQEVRAALDVASAGDLLKQEQMLDFIRARKYRETLLCHADLADRVVRRDFGAEQFRRLKFASAAMSSPGEEAGATVFTLPTGIRMESNHPGAVGLLRALEEAWPRALDYHEVEQRLAAAGVLLDAHTSTLLMQLAVAKFIELRTWNAPVAAEISERPKASACSRNELLTRTQATTLLHTTIRIDEAVSRRFLMLLDGTRDRAELAAALRSEFPNEPAEGIEPRIGPSLEFFHRAGFLEASRSSQREGNC